MTLDRRQLLASLGAAAGAATVPRPSLARETVKVGALRFTSHAASFVAYERGYFADEGLDVAFEFFQAAQPMAVAIASLDVDFGVSAITGGLVNLADKRAARVIGGALSEEPGIDGQMILASNRAHADGLTAPDRLRGRTFGITQAGSSFHYMAARIAAAEGIDPSELRLQPLQKVGAIIGALKSGQIDAWSIVPHIAKALVDGGAARRIGMVADYLPSYQVTTVFTSVRNAVNERAKTEAFLRAFARGAADFNAALVDRTAGADAAEEMVRLVHRYVYVDRSYAEAAPAIRNGAMRINEGAALNLASVQDQIAWFKSEGLVGTGIPFEHVVDTSYVEMI
jgi:NitT/TauT family transport system substrate-binding protein